ncbi:hypothetical protein [Streptomyces mirabilis]|uniref:hypothetical protein n=1 Tax=Streptomyces mirabilis TaxID=68239 RepID=UPI0036DB756A
MVLDYGIPLALITTLKRGPSLDQAKGTWFLWAVGSESVAVAASSLARVTAGHVLAVLAVVCWAEVGHRGGDGHAVSGRPGTGRGTPVLGKGGMDATHRESRVR